MTGIKGHDVSEEWAHSGVIEAGPFAFVGYCVGELQSPIEGQIQGAFEHLESRLESVGLGLEAVVQMDCLFHDVKDIPVMEKVVKEKFHGQYPVRKSIQTGFRRRRIPGNSALPSGCCRLQGVEGASGRGGQLSGA